MKQTNAQQTSIWGLVLLLGLSLFATDGKAAKELIDEIVVSARLRPISKEHLTSSVTILTAQELERRGQLFLVDALRYIPGTILSQEGGVGAIAAVRMRGAESDQTKVFIDGVEVNGSSSGQFNFGGLLVSQIERVEVVRGGQSLVHGAGAVGGVIYITTKKTVRPELKIYGGSFDTLNISGNMGVREQGFYLNVGGDIYRTSGQDISVHNAPEGEGESDREGFANITLNSKLGFDESFGAHQVRAQLNHRYVISNLQGDGGFPTFTDIDALTKIIKNEVGLNLSHQIALRSGFSIDSELRATHFDSKQRYITSSTRLSIEKRTLAEVKVVGAYEQKLFDTWLAVLGGWEGEEYLRPNENIDEQETKRFIATEASFSGLRLDVNAGVRFQLYSNLKNAFLWQVGLGYKPHFQDFIRLRASYGTSIQEPGLTQLYGFFDNYEPNPDLEAELATSLSGGADIDLSSLVPLKQLSFSVSGFSLNIENEISSARIVIGQDEAGEDILARTPINADGTSKRTGAEVGMQITIAKIGLIDTIAIATSYTYTDAKQSSGKRAVNRPEHVVGVTMRTDIQFFSFDWDLSWQSEQLDFNPTEVPAYLLLNIQFGFDVNDKLALFVRGENLTNERTANTTGYQRRGAGFYVGVKGRL